MQSATWTIVLKEVDQKYVPGRPLVSFLTSALSPGQLNFVWTFLNTVKASNATPHNSGENPYNFLLDLANDLPLYRIHGDHLPLYLRKNAHLPLYLTSECLFATVSDSNAPICHCI